MIARSSTTRITSWSRHGESRAPGTRGERMTDESTPHGRGPDVRRLGVRRGRVRVHDRRRDVRGDHAGSRFVAVRARARRDRSRANVRSGDDRGAADLLGAAGRAARRCPRRSRVEHPDRGLHHRQLLGAAAGDDRVDRIGAADRRHPPAAPPDHPARCQRGVRRRDRCRVSPGRPAARRTSTCRASS